MSTSDTKVLVTGAGGFIGSHLVTNLKSKGYWVRGVNLRPPPYRSSDADEFAILDLRHRAAAKAARANEASRLFYTSSACVYSEHRQNEANLPPLKEADAYPAEPPDAYGWEKLVVERLCWHYRDETPLETRVVRFHNIFGPY
jgi:GDP-D-mannose 3',5'-epimerase